jgi:hypothetical protein
MSKILVRRGQRVSQGQVIGLVGSTEMPLVLMRYPFGKMVFKWMPCVKITYWQTYDGKQ